MVEGEAGRSMDTQQASQMTYSPHHQPLARSLSDLTFISVNMCDTLAVRRYYMAGPLNAQRSPLCGGCIGGTVACGASAHAPLRRRRPGQRKPHLKDIQK